MRYNHLNMKSKYYREIFSGVFYIITLVLINSCVTFYQKEEFDIDKWQTNKDERYKSVKNIIKNNLFIGDSKEEILEKLGEYDFIFNDNHIRYDLATSPSNRIVNASPSLAAHIPLKRYVPAKSPIFFLLPLRLCVNF